MIQKDSSQDIDTETLYKVDELCNEFEISLRSNSPLSIESVIEDLSGTELQTALPELLWLEWSALRSRSEAFNLEDYISRFPEHEQLVRASWEVDCSRVNLQQAQMSRLLENGRYQLIRILAEGGLGRIWIARDHELNRDVAIKIVTPQLSCYPSIHDRFRREAKITSMLEHAGIAPIYSVGATEEQHPYFAMRLVPGVTLQQKVLELFAIVRDSDGKIRDNNSLKRLYSSLAFRELLGLFVFVCKVIDFAHQKSILHRDIKPSNIILGQHGEATVIDWGLAKYLNESIVQNNELIVTDKMGEDQTSAGDILGTPAYMSPEQARGEHDRINTCSDIYSLGATLFFILTGNSPRSEGESDTKTFPPSNEFIFPACTPMALQAICHRATAEQTEQRYSSAHELANDLERWLAYKPVSVYQDSIGVRLQRWIRDYPRWSAVLATFGVLSLLILTIGSFILSLHNKELQKSEQRLAASEITKIKTIEEMVQLLETFNFGEQLLTTADTQRITFEKMKESAETFSTTSYDEPTEFVIKYLVLTLLEAGKAKEALEVIDKSISHQSEKQRTEQTYHYLKGLALEKMDRVQEAKAIFTTCANAWSNLSDERKLQLAKYHIALCDQILGDSETIERFIAEDYSRMKELLGKDSDGYREATLMIATHYMDRRETKAAEMLLSDLGEPSKRGLQWISFQLLNARIASANQEKTKAHEIYRDIERRLNQSVDPLHPILIRTRIELANSLQLLREFDAAAELLQPCLVALHENKHEIAPPTAAEIHLQMVDILIGQDDIEAAEQHAKQCIELRRTIYGEQHPETLVARSVYGRLLTYLNRENEAEAILKECLTVQTKILGKDHIEVLHTMSTLLGCLSKMGRNQEVIEGTKAILEIRQRVYGDSHPTTLDDLTNLCFLQMQEGMLEEALDGLKRNYSARKSLMDVDPAQRNQFYVASMLLGLCYGRLQENEQATKFFVESVEGQLESHGPSYPDIYTTLFYSRSVGPQGYESDTLIALHKKVLDALDNDPNSAWKEKCDVLNGLGELFHIKDLKQEAMAYLQRSRREMPDAESLSDQIGHISPFLKNRLTLIGLAFDCGKLDDAEIYLTENEKLLARLPGNFGTKFSCDLYRIAIALERQDPDQEKLCRRKLPPFLRNITLEKPYHICIDQIVAETLGD